MTIKIIGDIAVIHSDTPLITDGQSALDLTATVYYEQGITKMAINKEAISEDFFKLSTGLAGEVAQKFVNYHFSVAIFGDFSVYTSKPLRDYIYECNKGAHLNFAADEKEAIRMLGGNSHAKSGKYRRLLHFSRTEPLRLGDEKDQAVYQGEESMTDLMNIPGIGKNMAQHLTNAGYPTIESLKGKTPEDIYIADCAAQGTRVDRCALYCYRLAVHYADHDGRLPEDKQNWWDWKD